MRKLSILSYIFAGLMLSSCDGYLKEDPRDQLYPEDAYDLFAASTASLLTIHSLQILA